MEISYRKPVLISEGEITLRASLVKKSSRLAEIDAKLFGNDGQLCASATVKYFILSQEKAVNEFFYPGSDAFFEPEDGYSKCD
jgi:acyl-coenzyme A thioesterase PaaI-like protein